MMKYLSVASKWNKIIIEHTTILTPNRRLATVLRKQYVEFCQKNHRVAWKTPDILPLQSWLLRLFSELEDRGKIPYLLLSPLQEWMLWSKICKFKNLISSVQDAWKILKQWNVSYTHPEFLTKAETTFFASIATLFQEACKHQNWLDESSLLDTLPLYLEPCSLPKHLVFFEFNEIYPQLHQFIEYLKGQNVNIEFYSKPKHNTVPVCVSLPDFESEILAAARFALSETIEDSNKTIAIVVPDLNQKWKQIVRVFKQELPKFSISGGESLIHYPVIRCAVFLLGLTQRELTTCEWKELLHSPYWGASSSRSHLKKSESDKILSFYDWVQFVFQYLETTQWPGIEPLNSETYQTVQHFYTVLQQLSTVDVVSSQPVPWNVFYDGLFHALESTLFQPESKDTQIQVLGLLEAAGQRFDTLWITGLSQDQFPPKNRPNPLIPYTLQKQFSMPHASSIRETHYAKRLLEELCGAASDVILSWPEMESEKPLLPSSFITKYSRVTIKNFPQSSFYTEALDTELFEDWKAPPLLETTLQGGMSLVRDYSICPFKAFAQHRLKAQEDSMQQCITLTPQEKGTLIHRILEIVWKELKSWETLQQYTDLERLIHQAVEQALIPFTEAFKHRKMYLNLEKTRLMKLILKAVLLEKNRKPFEIVSLEQETSGTFGNIVLKLRVDRIDALENGNWLLVDYKSGQISRSDWFGERPEEPQLPLYALCYPHIHGIAFSQIHPKAIKWVELSADNSNWSTHLMTWKNLFETMMLQYQDGIANADPNKKSACQTCNFISLCRNYENLQR